MAHISPLAEYLCSRGKKNAKTVFDAGVELALAAAEVQDAKAYKEVVGVLVSLAKLECLSLTDDSLEDDDPAPAGRKTAGPRDDAGPIRSIVGRITAG